MFKFQLKKIIITTLVFTLGIISLCLVVLPVYNIKRISDFIYSEYKTNAIFSSNKIYPIKGGIEAISKYSSSVKIVLTTFDPINPTYSLIINYDEIPESNYIAYQEVQTINLSRVDINSFKISSFSSNRINNLTFNEAVDLASRYDITTDFPGKENYDIINYPPLTQEEIDINREVFERQLKIEQSIQEGKEAFNKRTPQEQWMIECGLINRPIETIKEFDSIPPEQRLLNSQYERAIMDLERYISSCEQIGIPEEYKELYTEGVQLYSEIPQEAKELDNWYYVDP